MPIASRILILICLLSFSAITSAKENSNASPVSFKEIKGQVTDQYYQPRNDIRFYGSANGLSYYLKNTGLSYQLYKQHRSIRQHPVDLINRQETNQPDSTTIYRIDISWISSNPNAKIVTNDPITGIENYYTVATPVKNVKSYRNITYKNIYPSIDLKYYSQNTSLKYDYIVRPGGNPQNIRLKIDGAKSIIHNQDGSITISTPLGEIKEGEPKVFQEGKRIQAKWLLNNDILSFDIGAYNKTKVLVIDPLVFQWVMGYGLSGNYGDNDFGRTCLADKNGNAF